ITATETGMFNCSGKNPFQGMPELLKFGKKLADFSKCGWKAPGGLFQICGQKAYSKLPSLCKGSCTLGIIEPRFFLLPLEKGDKLGVPL
ncbi:ENR1 protein, partial [Melanocharis versteri]|nr:ENR1 protein [Melanocharis versteri]NXA87401.1 ENR1 protein [Melanocharis versteri]